MLSCVCQLCIKEFHDDDDITQFFGSTSIASYFANRASSPLRSAIVAHGTTICNSVVGLYGRLNACGVSYRTGTSLDQTEMPKIKHIWEETRILQVL